MYVKHCTIAAKRRGNNGQVARRKTDINRVNERYSHIQNSKFVVYPAAVTRPSSATPTHTNTPHNTSNPLTPASLPFWFLCWLLAVRVVWFQKTNGFPGADFRKFKTPEEASEYVHAAEDAGAGASAPEGWATMWFDGGCRGSPGPSGAGAVIFNDKEKELYRCCAVRSAGSVSSSISMSIRIGTLQQ